MLCYFYEQTVLKATLTFYLPPLHLMFNNVSYFIIFMYFH